MRVGLPAFPLPTERIRTPRAMEVKCKAHGHLPISSTAQSRRPMDLNFKFMSIDNVYIISFYFGSLTDIAGPQTM